MTLKNIGNTNVLNIKIEYMSDKNFVTNYLNDFSELLKPDDLVINKIIECKNLLIDIKKNNRKVLIFG